MVALTDSKLQSNPSRACISSIINLYITRQKCNLIETTRQTILFASCGDKNFTRRGPKRTAAKIRKFGDGTRQLWHIIRCFKFTNSIEVNTYIVLRSFCAF